MGFSGYELHIWSVYITLLLALWDVGLRVVFILFCFVLFYFYLYSINDEMLNDYFP